MNHRLKELKGGRLTDNYVEATALVEVINILRKMIFEYQ